MKICLMKSVCRMWPYIVYTGRGSQRLCWKRFENPRQSEAAAGHRRSYLGTPLPSVMVSFRSTPEMFTVSDDPSVHLISTLSTVVAAPRPKCKVISFCEV